MRLTTGLRGLPVDGAKQNLQAIIDRTKSKYPAVKVVLVGMQVPSNLGRDYTTRFRAIFLDLAATNGAALIPFLLDGVGGVPELNLPMASILRRPVIRSWQRMCGKCWNRY